MELKTMILTKTAYGNMIRGKKDINRIEKEIEDGLKDGTKIEIIIW